MTKKVHFLSYWVSETRFPLFFWFPLRIETPVFQVLEQMLLKFRHIFSFFPVLVFRPGYLWVSWRNLCCSKNLFLLCPCFQQQWNIKLVGFMIWGWACPVKINLEEYWDIFPHWEKCTHQTKIKWKCSSSCRWNGIELEIDRDEIDIYLFNLSIELVNSRFRILISTPKIEKICNCL